jgi:hypothetical protein
VESDSAPTKEPYQWLLYSQAVSDGHQIRAGVAQLVEQRIRNAKVTSSTPVTGTKKYEAYIDSGH